MWQRSYTFTFSLSRQWDPEWDLMITQYQKQRYFSNLQQSTNLSPSKQCSGDITISWVATLWKARQVQQVQFLYWKHFFEKRNLSVRQQTKCCNTIPYLLSFKHIQRGWSELHTSPCLDALYCITELLCSKGLWGVFDVKLCDSSSCFCQSSGPGWDSNPFLLYKWEKPTHFAPAEILYKWNNCHKLSTQPASSLIT